MAEVNPKKKDIDVPSDYNPFNEDMITKGTMAAGVTLVVAGAAAKAAKTLAPKHVEKGRKKVLTCIENIKNRFPNTVARFETVLKVFFLYLYVYDVFTDVMLIIVLSKAEWYVTRNLTITCVVIPFLLSLVAAHFPCKKRYLILLFELNS